MLKLVKLGGVLIGSTTLLGIVNGKFNQPKPFVPKFDQKEFEEKMKQMNELSLTTPKFSFPINNREENLKKLTNTHFDVLIIGGGATGAGVLLNLYNKGLKCALIESRDFASGTSSKSTKLAHGGIRYLEEVFHFKNDSYQKFKLVVEALVERDFFANSAPHLNNIVEIKIPLSGSFKLVYYFSGVLLYHFLYFIKSLPNIFYIFPGPKIYLNHSDSSSHQHINNYSLSNNFKYYVSLHECQMFDSRQNILSLMTTTIDQYIEGSQASVISNYTEFKEFLYDSNNFIVGVNALDKLNNKVIEIKAKTVINCAGFKADNLFDKKDLQFNKLISTSKGTHIVMKNNIFKVNSGLMIPKTSDNRVIFILPYQDYYIIGTTDNLSEKTDLNCPTDVEVDYLVKELKNYFNIEENIIRENITSKWSGLRPLFRNTENTDSKSISRGHIIKRNENGLVSVFGGKWTTYRKMGEDLVEFLEKENLIEKSYSNQILNLKLSGSYHLDNLERNYTYQEEKEILENLKNYIQLKYLLDRSTADKLVFNYGFNAIKVLEFGATNKTNVKIDESLPFLESQILYSVRHEMAIKPNDIICRRIGISFLDEKIANSLIEKVTQIMGKELKWNANRIKKEIEEARNNMKYFL